MLLTFQLSESSSELRKANLFEDAKFGGSGSFNFGISLSCSLNNLTTTINKKLVFFCTYLCFGLSFSLLDFSDFAPPFFSSANDNKFKTKAQTGLELELTIFFCYTFPISRSFPFIRRLFSIIRYIRLLFR